MKFVDLQRQYQIHKNEIDAAILKVLDHGAYIMGPEVLAVERQLATFTGVKHCILASSGTDTLLMALMALDIQPGDEVITVPFTFIAPVEVIALLRATPVFVDVEADTFNMDLDQLEAAITPKTKAIIPVSLFGQMPDYKRINAIAAKYNIPVIEDGAQSFGATQNGQRSCGVSTIGSTSFYPAKPLGCYGDAGALFTNDDVLASKMRAIRTHGGEKKYHHLYVGINGRCDTVQAAILGVKLKYFEDELQARRTIAARYDRALQDVCTIPKVQLGNTHTYAQYTIRLEDRDGLADLLQKQDIPTCIFYPECLHLAPAFSYLGLRKGTFPVAEQITHEVISLPMHPWLEQAEQELICQEVIKFAESRAKV